MYRDRREQAFSVCRIIEKGFIGEKDQFPQIISAAARLPQQARFSENHQRVVYHHLADYAAYVYRGISLDNEIRVEIPDSTVNTDGKFFVFLDVISVYSVRRCIPPV